MTPVSFIATDDPDAAQVFYRDVMGLVLEEASPFALAFLDGGHTLRVQIVPDFTPAGVTAHGWEVTDIAAEVAVLGKKGVTCLTFAQMEQSASGIWTSPDGHQIAWFNDPCGNILSFTQRA